MHNLPKKMNFYCREKGLDGVYPTFPVNVDSKQETAISWACNSYPYTEDKYTLFTFDNTKFKDVYIESLDKRGNGGRAYQVIITHKGNKFRVDLRETALMDVIMNTGIEAGGKLNGEFVFIILGSQTTLVRKGSKDYNKAVDKSAEKKLDKIPNGNLKIGHLYSSLNGNEGIFVGEYFVNEIKDVKGEILIGKPVKKLVFLKNNEESKRFCNQILTTDEIYYEFYIELQKNHSYRTDNGKVCDITEKVLINNLKTIAKRTRTSFVEKEYFYVSKYELSYSKRAYEMASLRLQSEKESTLLDPLCEECKDYFKIVADYLRKRKF